MPTKRKSAKSSKPAVRRNDIPSSTGISYDTMTIIVILLLLFVHPLGLIFMWVWMRTWLTWVKIVITLPLIIGIIFVMTILYFIGNAIHNGGYYYQRRGAVQRMYNKDWNSDGNTNMMYISPTASQNSY